MQGQEPSPSWHVWSLLREGFVFSLSTKVKQFCSFQGFLKNKQTKFLKVLNLNRLNLLDGYLYQKTVRDLSSSLIESSHDFLFLRPREKFRCFFLFVFFLNLGLLCISTSSSVVSGFLLPYTSLAARSFLASTAACNHGKNDILVILAANLTILTSHTAIYQNAVLGNMLLHRGLHFSRNRV